MKNRFFVSRCCCDVEPPGDDPAWALDFEASPVELSTFGWPLFNADGSRALDGLGTYVGGNVVMFDGVFSNNPHPGDIGPRLFSSGAQQLHITGPEFNISFPARLLTSTAATLFLNSNADPFTDGTNAIYNEIDFQLQCSAGPWSWNEDPLISDIHSLADVDFLAIYGEVFTFTYAQFGGLEGNQFDVLAFMHEWAAARGYASSDYSSELRFAVRIAEIRGWSNGAANPSDPASTGPIEVLDSGHFIFRDAVIQFS